VQLLEGFFETLQRKRSDDAVFGLRCIQRLETGRIVSKSTTKKGFKVSNDGQWWIYIHFLLVHIVLLGFKKMVQALSACDVNRSIDEVLASSNPSLVSDNGISLCRATTTQEWSAASAECT
jgi:hypothetical protein